MLGSWKINDDMKKDINFPKEVEDAIKGALGAITGFGVEPIKCLASQVVNGTNYAVLAKTYPIIPNPYKSLSIVFVNVSTDKKAILIGIQNLF